MLTICSLPVLEIEKLKADLSSEFEMKNLGQAKKILGIEISRNMKDRNLFLSQKTYISKLLSRYGMEECKPVTTPLASHFRLSAEECPKLDEEKKEMESIPYTSAVGSLMYAMICTQPDLAHGMSVVSRFMVNPGKMHWSTVRWMFRYLKGTRSHGLLYKGVESIKYPLEGYVDANYAVDLDKKKSSTGYVFLALWKHH